MINWKLAILYIIGGNIATALAYGAIVLCAIIFG